MQTESKPGVLDLPALRAKLAAEPGSRLYRSLDELAETEEFLELLHREYPERASEWTDPAGRRTFLKLMGASLALAGVGATAGCDPASSPPEKVLPYVRQPENLVQGVPLYFATAVSLGGVGTGVVATSRMGRPTMLEGNPRHPDSLGSIDSLTQASLLDLYDPDRSQAVIKGKGSGTYDGFQLAAQGALEARRAAGGEGVRLLTQTVTSPTLARQVREFLKQHPKAVWHQYEPAGPHGAKAGLKAVFGRPVSVRHRVARADVIVALDADFLANGVGRLCDARAYSQRREPPGAGAPVPNAMNRLYAVEPTLTVTGSQADHRLALRAADVLPFALGLARRLGVAGLPAAGPAAAPAPAAGRGGAGHDSGPFLDALAKDLQAHKGASLVLAGAGQPAYVHALAAAMNHALENDKPGGPVEYAEPVEAEPADHLASITDLCRDMNAGKVAVLLVLGGNPVYTAPADLKFAAGLAKVGLKARLGLHEDETSELCDWHLPEAHELETWGDVRGADGTATIQQPLIAPLYGGRSAAEVVASLLRGAATTRGGFELVRQTWRERVPAGKDFDEYWKTSVHAGVVEGTAAATLSLTPGNDLGVPPAPAAAAAAAAGELEVVFRPDPTVWDGRFNNNGWLQELPKPITKLTWDNAALVSLQTAERLGADTGDVVEIEYRGRKVAAAVMILPGQAAGSVTLHLGYGRTRTGRTGEGAGFNAYALRTADAPGFGGGAKARKTGASRPLASTQAHRNVEDFRQQGEAQKERGIVRVTTLADFIREPDFVHHGEHGHEPPADETLYRDDYSPPVPQNIDPDYQWGMTVDLNSCTGCGACVLACQAENNSPVVGKEQVLKSREMHWMEVDRYFDGDPDAVDLKVYHQPRLCMHCEKAPCEVVCPVAATVHDHEGLNVMVYNRCVGTRYCSNNCPYKVRHFNFLQYADLRTPSLALLNNPDVTVRARGVMEKCTYCVQRINESRYASEREHRRLRDGDVITACQSACPTRAITFGDISDKESAVSKRKGESRNYGMLAELNTRPRTTYLAKLRNPNPEIETEARHGV